MIWRAVSAVALVLSVDASNAACRQALVLGLDVSGSVDAREYRLQIDGVAGALARPDVQDAVFAFPDAPVHLMVFEWAGQNSQRVLVPWTVLTDQTVIARITDRLKAINRSDSDPATAIGQAMEFAARALSTQSCWRKTLDLSGDGKSNAGIRPGDVKRSGSIDDVTINGLVVGADAPVTGDSRQVEIGEIWAYYQNEVIQGQNAFVETALGFEDFENAMARKLLRELQVLAVSQLQD